MKLILLVGPCGSGKTTYSQEMLRDVKVHPIEYINQDSQGKNHLELFKQAVQNKCDIIIDRMGFSKEQRERYLKPAREAGYETEIVVFHVPRQTCFERIMARENHPTINGDLTKVKTFEGDYSSDDVKKVQANSALDTFFTKYERVEDNEADKVTRLGWDNDKTTAIICDLDGTLCNIEHRLHHVKHEIKKHNRWDLFNKEIPNDRINEWCSTLIDTFLQAGYHDIVLCSGRVDTFRPETETWLNKYDIRYTDLFMRHRSDFRQDYIIKEVILDFEILPRFKILFAVDDRKQVVDMWRRRGIVTLACADGDF